MTRESQKKLERFAVDRYLRLRGIEGELRPGPEPPDFVLTFCDEDIAIEVTEYHTPDKTDHGFTRREVEAAWKKLNAHVGQYRENARELDRLSVRLEFRSLHLPKPSEWDEFIAAIEIEIAKIRTRIGHEFTAIKIGPCSAPLLACYLEKIRVREVHHYLEWTWNFDFGGVGTSDRELFAVIGPKCRNYRPKGKFSRNWLIVLGDGHRLSEIAAPQSVSQLSGFSCLNRILGGGPFDAVAILDKRSFQWTRDDGWQQLDIA